MITLQLDLKVLKPVNFIKDDPLCVEMFEKFTDCNQSLTAMDFLSRLLNYYCYY